MGGFGAEDKLKRMDWVNLYESLSVIFQRLKVLTDRLHKKNREPRATAGWIVT